MLALTLRTSCKESLRSLRSSSRTLRLSFFLTAEFAKFKTQRSQRKNDLSGCGRDDLVEGFGAAFADGGVLFELADAGRVIPAAFAFLAVGFLDLDLQLVALVHFYLGYDEDVSKFRVVAGQEHRRVVVDG